MVVLRSLKQRIKALVALKTVSEESFEKKPGKQHSSVSRVPTRVARFFLVQAYQIGGKYNK
jgi:hypothetical protein